MKLSLADSYSMAVKGERSTLRQCGITIKYICFLPHAGFPSSSAGISLQHRRPWFDSWVGKIPWRTEWLPTPEFLPGELHGQRSLAVYSHGVAKSQTQLTNAV